MKESFCSCFPWKKKVGVGNDNEDALLQKSPMRHGAWASSTSLQANTKVNKQLNLYASPTKKEKLLFFGLNNSGKTSLINAVDGRNGLTLPTRTLTVSPLVLESKNIQLLDAPSSLKWELVATELLACIFVIDLQDVMRLALAKRELTLLASHPDLVSVPLLIVLNKAESKDKEAAKRQLNLQTLSHHNWTWCFCSIRTGEGVSFVKDWIKNNTA